MLSYLLSAYTVNIKSISIFFFNSVQFQFFFFFPFPLPPCLNNFERFSAAAAIKFRLFSLHFCEVPPKVRGLFEHIFSCEEIWLKLPVFKQKLQRQFKLVKYFLLFISLIMKKKSFFHSEIIYDCAQNVTI